MIAAKQDWAEESSHPILTPEQIITWLEGHRELMIEVWTNNPNLRLEWEKINL